VGDVLKGIYILSVADKRNEKASVGDRGISKFFIKKCQATKMK